MMCFNFRYFNIDFKVIDPYGTTQSHVAYLYGQKEYFESLQQTYWELIVWDRNIKIDNMILIGYLR